jgi:hypothetical protein
LLCRPAFDGNAQYRLFPWKNQGLISQETEHRVPYSSNLKMRI